MPGVIRNIDQMLASVCDIENYVEKNATSIENISTGKLERNGENLVVMKSGRPSKMGSENIMDLGFWI